MSKFIAGLLQFRSFLLALTTALVLTACASPQPKDYVQEKPVLDLKEYFNGTVDAWGVFQDRSGKVVKRFTVVMKCTWNGDTGVLDEDFTYSDGTTQKRVWTLKKNGNSYTGTAADVLGQASGETAGNAFQWKYTMLLPVDGTTYEVQFDDWMYLMDDKVMLNRATMSKFGIELGEVLLSFRKRDQ
ncbi:MAG TPA: DUF3833 domain-containing protein [Limnobacter sp.]|nr:DUF3833 domain-containing protein [Limnobacter sp.]